MVKDVMSLLLNPLVEIYVPDGTDPIQALRRTTHLAIGAHQDDVEIMAQHGILACFDRGTLFFTAVIVTNGSGSPRSGKYRNVTDEEMMRIRCTEQKRAADIGRYSAVVFLNYPSSAIKSKEKAPQKGKKSKNPVIADLANLLSQMKPAIIYTHEPADRHLTHIAVTMLVVESLRLLPIGNHPQKLYGCEVWRSLDWVCTDDLTILDLSGHRLLRKQLLRVFESQISGGKRYDLATIGRQSANATFRKSHDVDAMDSASLALDLTPLMRSGDLKEFIEERIKRFANEVLQGILEVTQ